MANPNNKPGIDRHPVSERLEGLQDQLGYDSLKAWHQDVSGDGYSVSYEAVRNYHWNREPPLHYVNRVSERFGVRLHWLIRGEKPVFVEENRQSRYSALREALLEQYDDWEEVEADGESVRATFGNLRAVLREHGVPWEVHGPLLHLIARAHRYDVARKRREEYLDGLEYGDGGLSDEEVQKANRPLRDYLPEEEIEVPKDYAREFVERRLDLDTAHEAREGSYGEHVAALLNQSAVAFIVEFGSRTAKDRHFKRTGGSNG